MGTQDKNIHYLKDYQPSAFEIDHVDMEVNFEPGSMRIVSRLNIKPAADTKFGTALELDGEELELISLKVDSIPVEDGQFTYANKKLILHSPPEGRFVLETEVAIKPEQNTQLMGLYRSNDVWCTQCEAEGFRRISFMADRPDVLCTYRVRLEADKKLAPVLLANGNLLEQGDAKGGRHYAIWDDPFPKPTYLFAVVAGDLGSIADEFVTRSGRKVALGIYCEHGKTDRCSYAMDALKRSMTWDEERFGREYDLDVFNIVAVSDFNFGAMENKGLNIFNDKFILAKPETATDGDYYNIERIVAHEYFHNWTGNRVTCRDWFQLCLKEGLTVYRDQEFTSDVRSRSVKRIGDVRGLRASQFPEDAGPLAHPPRPDNYAEINNFYTSTVYNKGAEVVRMLATLLGADEFRKGCDLYFERHDGEATTIESWLKVFEDSSGRDLSQFSRWYTQAGTPEITVSDEWDAEKQTYRLKLSQSVKPTPGQPDKEPLVVPIKFGLIGPNGQEIMWSTVSGGDVQDGMIILDQANAELVFEGVSAKPVASLLREFSAPVNLVSNESTDDQFFLARHDSDPYNRWQALQNVATAMMVKNVQSGNGFSTDDISRLAEALGESLENKTGDNSFKALALTLPGQGEVTRALGKNINPETIYRTRRDLLKEISTHLSEQLSRTFKKLESGETPSQNIEQVQNRALRNQCLSLMVADGSDETAKIAEAHYHNANNLTDRVAALAASTVAWTKGAEQLLAQFGSDFASDPLLYDKWLALNASRPDDGALDRVVALFEDPEFPKTNPNRLRALLGTFAMGNPAQFTRVDGKGFEFIASACARIDPKSPQVAAQLLTAFRDWRTWEPNRASLAQGVLENMAKSRDLSVDAKDILTRILAG